MRIPLEYEMGYEERTETVTRNALFSTRWRRQRYYIEDGFIRPAQRSEPKEYNPLASYFERGQTSRRDQLHLALAGLNTSSDDQDEQIEKFCSEWGLLGLYQHRLIQLTYVPGPRGGALPRHRPPHSHPEVVETPLGRAEHPARERRERVELFAEHRLTYGHGTPEADQPLAEYLADMELDIWWKDPAAGGEALVLKHGRTERVRLADYYASYFPQYSVHLFEIGMRVLRSEPSMLPEYPTWSSPWLWNELCEPVEAFCEAVNEFQDTARLCRDYKDGQHFSPDQAEKLERVFNQHLTLAGLRLRYDRHSGLGRLEQEWQHEYFCPSLLSAAYLLLMLTFSGAAKLRFCRNEPCGKPFEAERPDREFCSRSCQKAQQQRLRRRRQSKSEARSHPQQERGDA